MALTAQEQARLDEVIRVRSTSGGAINTAPSAQPSSGLPRVLTQPSLSPEEQARLDSLIKAKGLLEQKMMDQTEKKPSLMSRVAGGINDTYEGYKNLPVVKQVRQGVGGLLGGLSAIIGGGVAAVGTPIVNAVKGRPLLQDLGSNIKKNAMQTGKFGYDIGSEGIAAAPLGGAGKLVNGALALGQGYQGAQDIKEGLSSKDPALAIQGGLSLGTALLGAKGTIKGKGLILDKSVSGPLKAGVKELGTQARAKAQGMSVEQVKINDTNKVINKAAQVYDDVLGSSKRLDRARQSSELRGQETKSPGKILAEHNILLEADGNKNLNTTDARQQVREKINSWDDVLDSALQDEQPRVSLEETRRKAVASVAAEPNMSALSKDAAIKQINQSMAAEIKRRGPMVTDKQANQVKRSLYNDSYSEGIPIMGRDGLRKAASFLKERIETLNDDVDIKKINQIMGELSQADKMLAAKNGSPVKGARLGKLRNQIVGGIAGHALGPLGPVAGAVIGDASANFLYDPYRRTVAAQRGIDLQRLSRPPETTLDSINGQMQSRNQTSASRKLLPAPAIAPKPPEVKQPTQTEIVQILRERGMQGPLTKVEMDNARAAQAQREALARQMSVPRLSAPGSIQTTSPGQRTINMSQKKLQSLEENNSSILQRQRDNLKEETSKKRTTSRKR